MHRSKRRLFLLVFVLVVCTGVSLLNSGQAHAATPKSTVARPFITATGGSCGGWSIISSHDSNGNLVQIGDDPCISGATGTLGNFVANPDSYQKFTAANPNLWSSCSLTYKVFDVHFNVVESGTINCLAAARANSSSYHWVFPQVQGPIFSPCPQFFLLEVWTHAVYNGTVSLSDNGINSPWENFIC